MIGAVRKFYLNLLRLFLSAYNIWLNEPVCFVFFPSPRLSPLVLILQTAVHLFSCRTVSLYIHIYGFLHTVPFFPWSFRNLLWVCLSSSSSFAFSRWTAAPADFHRVLELAHQWLKETELLLWTRWVMVILCCPRSVYYDNHVLEWTTFDHERASSNSSSKLWNVHASKFRKETTKSTKIASISHLRILQRK